MNVTTPPATIFNLGTLDVIVGQLPRQEQEQRHSHGHVAPKIDISNLASWVVTPPSKGLLPMVPAQELLSLGNVELVGAPSTSWKTKSGMVNWQLCSIGRMGNTEPARIDDYVPILYRMWVCVCVGVTFFGTY